MAGDERGRTELSLEPLFRGNAFLPTKAAHPTCIGSEVVEGGAMGFVLRLREFDRFFYPTLARGHY